MIGAGPWHCTAQVGVMWDVFPNGIYTGRGQGSLRLNLYFDQGCDRVIYKDYGHTKCCICLTPALQGTGLKRFKFGYIRRLSIAYYER